VRSEYPETAQLAVHLLPLVAKYRSEAAFSKYVLTKTKQRSKLNPEADVPVQLSIIKTELKNVISGNQAHPSNYLHVQFNGRVKQSISFNYGVLSVILKNYFSITLESISLISLIQ